MDARATSPAQTLRQLITGTWVAQALYVVATLGIADLLRDGDKTAAALAAATGAHAPSLYRVLRALASVGVFHETESGSFRLTAMGEYLRGDVPGSMRTYAAAQGQEERWRPWGAIMHSVLAGQSAFEHVFGMELFEYYAQHPEAAATFDEAMAGRATQEHVGILSAYDFSGLRCVVDVGGGRGALLAAILERYPAIQGVLYDLPGVIDRAPRETLQERFQGRCTLMEGSFFESVPSGSDAYILNRVIHDWDDEHASRILTNCRQALASGGRLLVIEIVLPPGNAPSFGKILDLAMLVTTHGGRERTAEEYRALLGAAGLRLTSITPTPVGVSVIEATSG